jgi:UDPglucose 6-dehydrogenase
LNAFLATSVSFINEIASICEQAGADATEVERGLKSDGRIGQRAYLHPGAAFAGGTLARDLLFLREIASRTGRASPLIDGVKASNDLHAGWVKRRFSECIGTPKGKAIAVLGLTYKPGTDTLRRSSAVEACRWLSSEGASIRAYDPAVNTSDPEVARWLEPSAEEALRGADALLVATAWPEFRNLSGDVIANRMKSPIVIDPGGHLEDRLRGDQRIRYFAVGRSR